MSLQLKSSEPRALRLQKLVLMVSPDFTSEFAQPCLQESGLRYASLNFRKRFEYYPNNIYFYHQILKGLSKVLNEGDNTVDSFCILYVHSYQSVPKEVKEAVVLIYTLKLLER